MGSEFFFECGGEMTFAKQCYLKIYAANTHAEREKQRQVKMKVVFYVDNSLVEKKRFNRFKVRDKLYVSEFEAKRTVILFSSRYLLSAKSICPTCKQTIYIFMQNMRAAPSNK
jgi:hypothetical protein